MALHDSSRQSAAAALWRSLDDDDDVHKPIAPIEAPADSSIGLFVGTSGERAGERVRVARERRVEFSRIDARASASIKPLSSSPPRLTAIVIATRQRRRRPTLATASDRRRLAVGVDRSRAFDSSPADSLRKL